MPGEIVSYIHFFAAIIYLACAVFILLQNPRSFLNRFAALLFAGIAVWSLGNTVIHDPHTSRQTAEFCFNINSIGWTSFSSIYLMFILAFVRSKYRLRRWLFLFLFAPPMVFIYRQWTDPLIAPGRLSWYGWPSVWIPSVWTFLYFSYYAVFMSAGIILLARFVYFTKDILKKRQGRIILICTIVPLVFGTISNVIVPFRGIRSIPDMADVGVLVMVSGMAYAIARYRIFRLSATVPSEYIVSAMRDIFLFCDFKGKIVSVNRTALDQLHWEEPELIGKSLADIISVDDGSGHILAALLRGAPVRNLELTFQRPGDEKLPCMVSTSVIPDHEGRNGGIVCLARDISAHKITEADLRAEVRAQTKLMSRAKERLEREIEEHRKTEEQLRSSKMRLNILFEEAPDAIYVNDMKGTFLDGNKKAEQIVGYSRKELIGKNFMKLNLLPASEIGKAAKLLALNALGKSTTDEFILHRKDGRVVNLEITAHPITIGGRRLVMGIARDISARVQAERELRESEQRYRQVVELAPDHIVTVNLQGFITSVNDSFCRDVGYAKEEIVGKHFTQSKILRVRDMPRFLGIFTDVIRGKVPKSIELPYRTKNGGEKIGEVRIGLLKQSHKITGIQTILRDLTDRRQAEKALRESEKKYRSFVQNFHGIAFKMTLDGTPLFFHGAVERITGYSENNFLTGKPAWTEIIHPEDLKRSDEPHSAGADQSGYSIQREYRIVRKDGTIRWVQELAQRTGDDGNMPIHYQGVLYDITDRRALEDQLRQAQKMEAIGQLAGGVAHDFNNALGAISGYAELLRDAYGHLDEKLTRYSVMILQAAKRAANLTSKLLAFARRGTFDMAPLCVHGIIRETVQLLEHTIEKKYAVCLHLDADKSLVMGDATQMQNVILNLAINARDAMPDGGEITISTDTVDIDMAYLKKHAAKINPGSHIRITVRDTGIGMDKKTKERIFEPFFTTKEQGKGTGLGLASVYGTVRRHNGEIDVDSEPRKGAVIRILLPLATGVHAESIDGPADSHHGSGTILVVDDEETLLELASAMLADLGYTAHTYGDRASAMEYYRLHAGEIDLVILDVIMPGMTAVDCFREMRKINPGIRLLIVSGYTMDGDARTLMKEGATGFLQKPFEKGNLARAVHDSLRP